MRFVDFTEPGGKTVRLRAADVVRVTQALVDSEHSMCHLSNGDVQAVKVPPAEVVKRLILAGAGGDGKIRDYQQH
jgi:hypothetical protein